MFKSPTEFAPSIEKSRKTNRIKLDANALKAIDQAQKNYKNSPDNLNQGNSSKNSDSDVSVGSDYSQGS